MRLDQWLWAVRIYRTRTLAASAIKAGQVTVNGLPAKPAREVRAGEQIVARAGDIDRILKVVGFPPSRIGARLLPEFVVDLTPAEQRERRVAEQALRPWTRPKGSGRPTKRDRRQMDSWRDEA
jgi:ribosome-associated heat shock protein Hsp15